MSEDSTPYTPTPDEVLMRYLAETERHFAHRGQQDRQARREEAIAGFHRMIAKVEADALRKAHADLQAYTDAGAPFGHRPVEEFLLSRAEGIETGGAE